jgi:predicted ATPase/class 3 adenylate cyclase
MRERPTGTVTFLFTDLEGSTRLWEEHPDEMRAALARHDELLRAAIEAHDGYVVKTTGDGIHAAFASAAAAIEAARTAQRALVVEAWSGVGSLRVRMGIHSGEAELRDGDYYGTALNRAARLMSVAHGGQVVVSLATEELARDDLADEVTLRDLGDHRLRDLARAERIFQVCAHDLPADFEPLRSLDAFEGNLPAQVTSFLGRDHELGAVADALRESRLVTLTGVGGVGKTRLALQVAADLLPHFADGAWFCELAPATDDDALTQVIAATLRVAPRPGGTLESAIVDFLRAKRALVVLDNCEHLLDPVARLADQVLQACPDVRMLATSREALAIAGEQIRPVRSLRPVDARELFVARAEALMPAFAPDQPASTAIEEICHRLDGIPLAIELAAARVGTMSPVEIAALLDERFRLLTGGRRTAVERHQTLRATVDWSFSLLDERSRQVFERLGVFAGSFDGSAAAAVAATEGIDEWDVREALAGLVRQSLVNADANVEGVTRYSMLETLRQYAVERLDAAQASDRWRLRHAEHYARVAESIGPMLLRAEELEARRQLREDLDNLRAAFNWAIERDRDEESELAVVIAGELAVETAMHVASGIGWWALRSAERAQRSSPDLRHSVLSAAAYAAIQLAGDHERGEELARDALREGVPADSRVMLLAHTALAMVLVYTGRAEESFITMSEAIELVEDVPLGKYYASIGYSVRAAGLLAAGEDVQGRSDAEEALRIAREIRHPSSLALALFFVGWAESERDPERAAAAFEESIVLSRAGANDGALGATLARLAGLRAQAGDVAGACAALRESVAWSHAVGDQANLTAALWELVGLLEHAGRPVAADELTGALQEGVLGRFIGWHPDSEVAHATADSETRAAARARGARLTYEEVLELTLTSLDELA